MIKLTRLSQGEFMVNCEMIECIEETPDTIISMLSGKKLIVKESAENIRQQTIEYKRLLQDSRPVIRHLKKGE